MGIRPIRLDTCFGVCFVEDALLISHIALDLLCNSRATLALDPCLRCFCAVRMFFNHQHIPHPCHGIIIHTRIYS